MTTAKLILLSAILGAALAPAIMRGDAARAYPYSFDWPGQGYVADLAGNAAYRDLTFEWDYWVNSSGHTWTSVYPVTSYVHIANPSAGYHFDSWGLWVMWSCAFPYAGTSNMWYDQFSVTFGNPTTVFVPTWVFPCGQTFVRFGMCGNLLCGPSGVQMSYHSGYLEARIPSGSFYAVQHDWHY